MNSVLPLASAASRLAGIRPDNFGRLGIFYVEEMDMQNEHGSDLYALILRYATAPVLIMLIILSLVIINYLMSPAWQQGRRNKQIRKAVAAREALLAKHAAERQQAEADEQEGRNS
jgi:hypothetical protein